MLLLLLTKTVLFVLVVFPEQSPDTLLRRYGAGTSRKASQPARLRLIQAGGTGVVPYPSTLVPRYGAGGTGSILSSVLN